jgi:hypothetical protein
MLARTFDFLRLQSDKTITLIGAKFVSITDRCVALIADRSSIPNGFELLGQSQFQVGAEIRHLYYIDLPDERAPIEPDVCSPIVSFSNECNAALEPGGSARCRFNNGTEGMLESIIAVVKRLHQQLAPSVRNVWFTGFNDAFITDNLDSDECDIEIEVRPLVKRLVRPRLYTLVEVTCDGTFLIQPLTFKVSFSCEVSE